MSKSTGPRAALPRPDTGEIVPPSRQSFHAGCLRRQVLPGVGERPGLMLRLSLVVVRSWVPRQPEGSRARSGEGRGAMTSTFDERGVRFEYPEDWELELPDDAPATTLSPQSPARPAFVLVTLAANSPAPADLPDHVLE